MKMGRREGVRIRWDIFGYANEIYVANKRKLKTFFGAGRVQWDFKKGKTEKKQEISFSSESSQLLFIFISPHRLVPRAK